MGLLAILLSVAGSLRLVLYILIDDNSIQVMRVSKIMGWLVNYS